MTHPAVRLLALAMLALAVLLALRHPTAPATPPAKAPQLATTTTTVRPPGYVPTPAGPPPTTRPPS
jgi:hypothetical protein